MDGHWSVSVNWADPGLHVEERGPSSPPPPPPPSCATPQKQNQKKGPQTPRTPVAPAGGPRTRAQEATDLSARTAAVDEGPREGGGLDAGRPRQHDRIAYPPSLLPPFPPPSLLFSPFLPPRPHTPATHPFVHPPPSHFLAPPPPPFPPSPSSPISPHLAICRRCSRDTAGR
ncbi:hypothetical protein GGS23DRAFT_162686 [Durotheca rogersii]|uniref:uncharacterized protein n=1 Tax=Durotheca rogersii TaxID=419775 RepID=UPI0022202972|nr:uncharacterized protein GGS23DRAFT_162686 [Durotheca rogersii]KAI5867143.1 hypothetical protein GGS23DRAFT_162686 [Durotheca rogersii]